MLPDVKGRAGWPWKGGSPAQFSSEVPYPRITLVTPTWNQGAYIEQTIRSVLLQGYPNLEYFVVIDKRTNDHTYDVVEKYSPWITRVIVESRPGQVVAINRGLELASGEIFQWVNSDDFLAENALAALAETYYQAPASAWAGICVNFSEEGELEKIQVSNLDSKKLILGATGTAFHQPAIFLQLSGIKACGGIDENLHFAFDWDLLVRYLTLFPNVTYLGKALVHFRLHPNSKTMTVGRLFPDERIRILRKLLQNPEYGEIHGVCLHRLKTELWWRELESLHSRGISKKRRVIEIAMRAILDPRVRLTRFTAGAIQKMLRAHQIIS